MAEADERPAFYALSPGGWRDWWTLLHPPYTAWMLSYVAFGAVAAPHVDGGLLGLTAAGFFLGVGVTAHALDELSGHPLRTRIPDVALWTVALAALAGAVAIGVYGATLVSWWVAPFIAFGVFIVLAYNLELFGGWFHTGPWFALAWGAFPAVTAYFAQTGTVRWPALAVAAGCAAFSWTQRTLSTPVRRLRRDIADVEGTMTFRDGSTEPLTEGNLRSAPEAALRGLALGLPLLALGLVVARFV